jgi:hypothetical protein
MFFGFCALTLNILVVRFENMSSTAAFPVELAFSLELIVITSLVLGFGAWMMQQAKTLSPKRVTVLAKSRRQ